MVGLLSDDAVATEKQHRDSEKLISEANRFDRVTSFLPFLVKTLSLQKSPWIPPSRGFLLALDTAATMR